MAVAAAFSERSSRFIFQLDGCGAQFPDVVGKLFEIGTKFLSSIFAEFVLSGLLQMIHGFAITWLLDESRILMP